MCGEPACGEDPGSINKSDSPGSAPVLQDPGSEVESRTFFSTEPSCEWVPIPFIALHMLNRVLDPGVEDEHHDPRTRTRPGP